MWLVHVVAGFSTLNASPFPQGEYRRRSFLRWRTPLRPCLHAASGQNGPRRGPSGHRIGRSSPPVAAPRPTRRGSTEWWALRLSSAFRGRGFARRSDVEIPGSTEREGERPISRPRGRVRRARARGDSRSRRRRSTPASTALRSSPRTRSLSSKADGASGLATASPAPTPAAPRTCKFVGRRRRLHQGLRVVAACGARRCRSVGPFLHNLGRFFITTT